MSIQVMNIFKEGFKNVLEHKLEWFRVAFAPIVIWVIGSIIMLVAYWSVGESLWAPPDGATQVNAMQDFGQYPFVLILANVTHFITGIISMTCLYINGFRYGALNEGGNRWWTLNLDWRFIRLILYYILIIILATIYIGISAGITAGVLFAIGNAILPVILGIGFAVLGIYLALRIGLLFLLISLDDSAPLKSSWLLLKGNVWRLFLLMLLITFSLFAIAIIGSLIIVLLGIILDLITPILTSIAVGLGIIFTFLIWLFSWAFYTKAIVLVYKSFTEGKAF